MTDLEALNARVEGAKGPDRRLDAEIAELLGIGASYRRGGKMWAFTASIDAAITLVPKGWWWSVGDCSVSSDASVGPDVAHCDKATLVRFDAGIHCDLPHPSTPALALTAAALRARAHLTAGATHEQ